MGLSPEAAQQLAERASQADERAAVQESQLHNTGRDMGDWLGVDHGVALTGVQVRQRRRWWQWRWQWWLGG